MRIKNNKNNNKKIIEGMDYFEVNVNDCEVVFLNDVEILNVSRIDYNLLKLNFYNKNNLIIAGAQTGGFKIFWDEFYVNNTKVYYILCGLLANQGYLRNS